jgi:hypothetical protein
MVNRRQLLKLSALGTASFAAPLAYSASKMTMIYKTGNPIGSVSSTDLYDNAQSLDFFVNGPNPSYPDRLGVLRKSWMGMEGEFNTDQARRESEFDTYQAARVAVFNDFLKSSGFETPVDYVAGLEIIRPTQVLRFSGELYRAKDASLPFTTTSWAADAAKLFVIGDAALRQEMAGQGGAALSGFKRKILDAADAGMGNLNQFVSAQVVSIWECSGAVISKPNPHDPDTWDWSPALIAALAVSGKVVLNGRHTYRLQNIRLYDGCEIEIDKSAIVAPVTGDSQIFYCDDNTSSARNFSVKGGRVMNPSLVSNVTVFNCPQARRNVTLSEIYIDGGGKYYGWTGVYWSKLNWMTKMKNVEVESCAIGFKFRNAAAVMHAIECVALGCGIGFDLAHLEGEEDILNRIKISGGVCQSNNIGVLMRSTDGTILDGMHFENNGTDIDASGDKNVMIFAPELRGNNSHLPRSIGIKLRSVVGATIAKPIFAGIRSLGFLDIDDTNYLVNLDVDFRIEAPLMNDSMVANIGNLSGIRYVPNFSNYGTLGGLVIDCNYPLFAYQKSVPDGGAVVTAVNPVDGREIMITLRPAVNYTSGAISVFGVPIDVSGGTAIRAKNKTLHFIYRTVANGWVVISESAWT